MSSETMLWQRRLLARQQRLLREVGQQQRTLDALRCGIDPEPEELRHARLLVAGITEAPCVGGRRLRS